MKPTQYKIENPPEVRITLEFPNRQDGCDMRVKNDGIPMDAVPSYLQIAKENIMEGLKAGGRSKSNGEGYQRDLVNERVEKVMRVGKWEVIYYGKEDGNRDSVHTRICLIAKAGKDHAERVEDWEHKDMKNSPVISTGWAEEEKKKHDKNLMDNIDRVKNGKSAKELINRFEQKEDLTFVICGSGPSLRPVREKLSEVRDDESIKVIAINEALQYLSPEDVDYGFVLDRISKKEWASGYSDTYLIASSVVPPEITAQFKDTYFFRYPPSVDGTHADALLDRHEEVAEKLPILDIGRTATYSSFHMAYRCGADRVLFLGQDFSTTTELYSAMTEMTTEKYEKGDYEVVNGINDRPALTNKRLKRNMGHIKAQAAFQGDHGMEVINGSGRGIMDFESMPNKKLAGDNNMNMEPIPAIDYVKSEKERIHTDNGKLIVKEIT